MGGRTEATLRVMTYNLWVGGEAGGQPLDRSVEVIRTAAPDLVGLQETRGRARDNGREIATRLGWRYFDQGGGTAVLTPHEILGSTPQKWGVKVGLPGGGHAWIFNVHFMYKPYQPYQLLDIPYGEFPFIKSEAEAVRYAGEARGHQVAACLEEAARPQAEGVPVFLTGDFNEPSHLDWTTAAAAAGACPLAVSWPATRAAELAGFTDAYRAVHPDPVAEPGLTWTPTTAPDDPKDRHDRIDFVMVHGAGPVTGAWIVGERPERADLVVAPYPSDHRAVLAAVGVRD